MPSLADTADWSKVMYYYEATFDCMRDIRKMVRHP
jgi:hypothetical protein